MRIVAILSLLLLTSCYRLDGVSPEVDYEILVAATRDCSAAPSAASTPPNMMVSGFTRVNMACEAFFVDATKAQQDALFGNKSLDALQVATAAVLGATASPTSAFKALAITNAGVVLVKEVLNQANSIYAFNTHLYKVRELTKSAMASYKITAESNPPMNYCKAYDYVVEYATLCSLASMKLLLDSQVAIPSTPVGNAAPPAGFVSGGAGSGAPAGFRTGFRGPAITPTAAFTVRAVR